MLAQSVKPLIIIGNTRYNNVAYPCWNMALLKNIKKLKVVGLTNTSKSRI